MNNSSAITMSSPETIPLQGNIVNSNSTSSIDRDFALPKLLYPLTHQNKLAVPGIPISSMMTTNSLGRVFQELNMTTTSNDQNGQHGNDSHHTLSDTPPRSATSTAPSSPRL